MLNDCYKNNLEKYDWFILCDMDEFINLKFYNNIKIYLNQIKFNNCKVIYFNRVTHTDNGQIFYNNKTLYERFPKTVNNILSVKPILRGHIYNLIINNNHLINWNIESCYGFGQKRKKHFDFKYYYFDHFYFKSTEEFIQKVTRGDVYYNNTKELQMSKVDFYFESNNITYEKIIFIENQTKLNLSIYKQKLLNKK